MSPSLPVSIILVHGWFGTPSHWEPTLQELRSSGAELTAVDLPLTSLADNVTRVDQAINTAKYPVILVGHSYGGAVITQAGNHEKVKGLVYIAAFAPEAGQSIGDISAMYPLPSGSDLLLKDGILLMNPSRYHANMGADLSESEGWAMSVSQKPVAAITGKENVIKPSWKDKKSWYAISTEDKMIDPVAQRWMSGRMGADTIEIKGSHYTLTSQPKPVSALILKAANAIVAA
ncbi:hypothetical protein CspHIS471_0200460 [Cutaneotrichosporon sp. HIS471]|nr:hypothetical protein CspHIS471_0200460 [Cutaneotrichosporon sp. HIS471]